MVWASSVWTANTSFKSRVKFSDQSSSPVLARVSRAAIRTLLPDLRTLPSTRCATPSFSPISWAVAFLPLKENADVRVIAEVNERQHGDRLLIRCSWRRYGQRIGPHGRCRLAVLT